MYQYPKYFTVHSVKDLFESIANHSLTIIDFMKKNLFYNQL